MDSTAVDIQVICMLPDVFLMRCTADPVLSTMFSNISRERYSKMMLEILKKITYEGHDQGWHTPSYLDITHEHKAAWLRCFDMALSDLCMDDINAKHLYQRMSQVLDEMVPRKGHRRSLEICHSIKDAVSASNNPHEFISEIRHYLDKIDGVTP